MKVYVPLQPGTVVLGKLWREHCDWIPQACYVTCYLLPTLQDLLYEGLSPH